MVITHKEREGRRVRKNPDKVAAIRSRQRALGRELRRIYDEVVQEPVPDEFLDLLRQIDEAGGKKGNRSK